MKSTKFVAGLVTGLALLGTVSAHAAAQAVPLNISIVTYQQTTTTNPSGVITYISTPVTIKSADLVAKFATSTGNTLPAGALLGFSVINSTVDGVSSGDVVIMTPSGSILWDLNFYGNDTGHAQISISFSADVQQVSSSAYNARVPQRQNGLSTTFNGSGFGQLHFNIYANPTETVDAFVGWRGDFYDDVGSVQYVRANSGNQLTTGSLNFAGGGQIERTDADDNDFIQPANAAVSGAVANIPWNIFTHVF